MTSTIKSMFKKAFRATRASAPSITTSSKNSIAWPLPFDIDGVLLLISSPRHDKIGIPVAANPRALQVAGGRLPLGVPPAPDNKLGGGVIFCCRYLDICGSEFRVKSSVQDSKSNALAAG